MKRIGYRGQYRPRSVFTHTLSYDIHVIPYFYLGSAGGTLPEDCRACKGLNIGTCVDVWQSDITNKTENTT